MINHVVIDVDGVLTTGHMYYDRNGKAFKVFGPHDKDGMNILHELGVKVTFITADVIGLPIAYARIVTDWMYDESQLIVVSEKYRMEWFENNCDFKTTAFIADGYHDAPILARVKMGIAPASARPEARDSAAFVTDSPAGSGAVLDASLFIKSYNGTFQV